MLVTVTVKVDWNIHVVEVRSAFGGVVASCRREHRTTASQIMIEFGPETFIIDSASFVFVALQTAEIMKKCGVRNTCCKNLKKKKRVIQQANPRALPV